jgi:hypothetical protein
MKTRLEFVSNSSSCSFIVNDVAGFKSKLVELCKDDASSEFIDLWWLRNLVIRFSFDNNEENREKFKHTAAYIVYNSAYNDEPPSQCDGEITFDEWVGLDESFISLMHNVVVMNYAGYDGNENTLPFLFTVMKHCGIDVDNSCSEKQFTMFESIPKKVAQIACAEMLSSS